MLTQLSSPSRARLSLFAALGMLFVAGCGGGDDNGGGNDMPAVSISVAPATIVLGNAATLTWSASEGTACTASGAWTGSQPSSGTLTVTPTAAGATTYTLSCSGVTYSDPAQASTALTVTAPSAFSATKLVADTAGTGALVTDANLVNPWGVAFGPTTPAWVANAETNTSTLYNGNGNAQPAATPLVVQLPSGFAPTGIVFNGTASFVITDGGNSGPARFIFAGEAGMIGGWSPTVDRDNAVTVYTDDGGAIYKGLAIANNGAGDFLYAADFHNNKIDVFDGSFNKQTASATSFAFTDPELPAGYAPFGIQAIANGAGGATQLYVSYAKQLAPDNEDDETGAGLGLVNVFDTNGNLVTHLIPVGGALDAPWGIALAPADFGTLSSMLLIGNFGDGRINAFDPASGEQVGTVQDAAGTPFAVPGLWGIAFGNDTNNQPHNTLFYAAGTNDEANGEYGRIDLGATPPILNEPPVVALSAPPAGNVSGTVSVTATAEAPIAIAEVEFFANDTSLGVSTTAPYSVSWDTTQVADGAYSLTATATDADGNVGTSPAVAVTVANAAPAVTFGQLQTQIFTAICTACHVGASAPEGLRLDAANSYAALVGVASGEVPSVLRVKPGDPANSYLIHKLEGTAAVGGRMPLGGPYLDQATIDMVKAWIASGAPNN